MSEEPVMFKEDARPTNAPPPITIAEQPSMRDDRNSSLKTT
jgi:hypothetical protein